MIPRPASVSVAEGSYTLTSTSAFKVVHEELEGPASLFARMWSVPMGFEMPVHGSGDRFRLGVDLVEDDGGVEAFPLGAVV